jgi:hypothetical protein
MRLTKALAVAGAVALVAGFSTDAQRQQEQPSITFGRARVSLGMTAEQVTARLAEAARHLKFMSDKQTALVYRDGVSDDIDGQVTFAGGRVIYAAYQMPNVRDADELVQEIAGAVESMDTKTCTLLNYSAHGTGGGFSETSVQCGSQRFNVRATQVLGNRVRKTNVEIEMGQTVASGDGKDE